MSAGARLRLGAPLALLFAGLAGADQPAPHAPVTVPTAEVRVLLREGPTGLSVGTDGAPAVRVEAGRAGVVVAGRDVGAVWSRRGAQLRVDGRRLHGALEVRRTSAGLAVVNRVPLEAYVAGSLGREIYASWAPETLKAQAVVTRTYALHRAARARAAHWDLAADVSGQVYGGADAESDAVLAAVAATRGEWLAWRGEPILAAFHSASGGRTASAREVWGRDVPYLVSVDVEDEEDSPDTYWRATVSRPTLGRALAPLGIQVGPIEELRVVDRSSSGRAGTVQVRGRSDEAEITAGAVREALGTEVIRSTLFEIRQEPEGVVFVGSGHGHGVGMSQWGAQAMAKRGVGYREILTTFYPGTQLVRGGAR